MVEYVSLLLLGLLIKSLKGTTDMKPHSRDMAIHVRLMFARLQCMYGRSMCSCGDGWMACTVNAKSVHMPYLFE